MLTGLFCISTPFSGRLAVAPRPRGGDWLDDELRGWHEAGIDLVVSMLTADEAAEFDLGGEEAASAAHGIRYLSFPIPDRDVPASAAALRELVAAITQELAAGHGVAVHCRQGIGRAGLVAVAVLITTGIDTESAIARVSAARGRPVPETPAQKRWLNEFAAVENEVV
jgi:protein-tyrosine phosphatase